jgi:hypothetical protein
VPFVEPRRWTRDELRAERDRAEELFRDERRNEGPRAFEERYRLAEPAVRAALEATGDLLNLSGELFIADPGAWQVLRYFCAPPISEEDLWTLVGRKFKSVPASAANATAEALRGVLDSIRFPWLKTRRTPTEAEREAAVLATSGLVAYEKLRTARRGSSARKQEELVAELLALIGFDRDKSRSTIRLIDELPRGSFSRERKLDGAKCDLPVRLRDGRLLALECKVSNGPKNSWKRLHREVGGKSQRWNREFGVSVLTGAVLAGVFDLSCLVKAQEEQSVFLFWQHDLSPLEEFVKRVE